MRGKTTVAFLYNIRHQYPDTNDPQSQLETDFDDPATIDCIVKHLQNCGYEVLPIEANREAYLKLYENKDKIDIAFNYSEGIFGNDREAHIPSFLEMLQIPYTGSTPLTQALVLNKAKSKEILRANELPVLPHQVFSSSSDELTQQLSFPVIVKPLAEGSSAGITNKSVVYSKDELSNQLSWVFATFKRPVLVEKFIDGREFSISLLGNPPKILPFVEPDHSKLPDGYQKIDSLEVKWVIEEQSAEDEYLICPAITNKELKSKLTEICLRVWKALEIRDFCRIDLRCDRDENPYVLEINSPAGLLPPEISTTSYFPLAARKAKIDYDNLLKTIIDSAVKRYY